MLKGEMNDSDEKMLASIEGTLEEHNEGRSVSFVLVCIKRQEDNSEEDPLTRVEMIGNMPQEIVRHTLTKTLIALIEHEVDDLVSEHVCDDCKDKAH